MPTIRTANRKARTRKLRAKIRGTRAAVKFLRTILNTPSRPWFRLSLRGDDPDHLPFDGLYHETSTPSGVERNAVRTQWKGF